MSTSLLQTWIRVKRHKKFYFILLKIVKDSPCLCREAKKGFLQEVIFFTWIFWFYILYSSVADPDPDPPDPRVFGSPGSGSGSTSQRYGSGSGSCYGSGSVSFYHHAKKAKNSKKNLDSSYFVTLFEFLSLVNVDSKSHKQKKIV